MTIQQAYQQLLLVLYDIYDNREAANIADWIIEHVTGLKKIDRIINKTFSLNSTQQEQFQIISNQLSQHRPVQYILGEAWFAGMKLYVDENVLIPRPETEELVEWIVSEIRSEQSAIEDRKSKVEETEKLKAESVKSKLSILDIGTGSGCIPIAVKRKISNATVSAIDVSEGALSVAKRNAKEQGTAVDFYLLDFLKDREWTNLETYDIIVSNPPYVKQSEEATMRRNVLEHEPHLALFVPDEDSLIFYKKIALLAKEHLKESGSIFLEINEALANEVEKMFKECGYKQIEVRKDMQGKDRMVRVLKGLMA